MRRTMSVDWMVRACGVEGKEKHDKVQENGGGLRG